LVEVDEAGDLGRRGGVVVLAALLDRQGFQELASYHTDMSAVYSRKLRTRWEDRGKRGKGISRPE
jgi:hypothetical protein